MLFIFSESFTQSQHRVVSIDVEAFVLDKTVRIFSSRLLFTPGHCANYKAMSR